ncbi:MAG: ABC transporter ATP-binding protein [bacterium]|nr:ABC transporter ATP-binding protein [bacterium]
MSGAQSGIPVLALERVTGGYGGAEIIHEVSLGVCPGEIVVLIGPNGAGKSTVMNAVLGRLSLSAGRVSLQGRDITDTAPDRVVRQGVSYVPQTANVFPSLTVAENLEMGAYIRQDDFRPRMQEMYELFPPLAERRRTPAGNLSGGQRQMVAIAKALMVEPVVLLLDEPTAGLSPRFRGNIFHVIRDINSSGVTILMVEQNARQALGIADRGYVLVDGRNRFDDSGTALLADPTVGAMFLGGRQDGAAAT